MHENQHQKKRESHLHPPEWENPEPPREGYQMVVLGAGTAGLVTAAVCAALGARTALVEKHYLGGDCLNYGCVPSKTLIRSARIAAACRETNVYGVKVGAVEVDFSSVMERLRKIRADISPHDSVQRFTELGVDVFLGPGRYTSEKTLEVEGKKLTFKRSLIATGARAAELPVPGLKEAGYLTNETVFSLTELPNRLAVIGGGPIGCEMAQAFRRLGSEVSLFEKNDRILSKEEHKASEILREVFIREGIQVHTGSQIHRVEQGDSGKRIYFTDSQGKENLIEVNKILAGVGRQPNVEGLGLDEAGVEYDPRAGVKVNDYLQTSNSRIYAAGDICSALKFTHLADAHARIVVANALFAIGPFGRQRADTLTVPWTTYTEPEVAHVGLSEGQAREQGFKIIIYEQEFQEVDRAVTEGKTDGYVRLVAEKSGRILGATIVGPHAGEMISEISVAMAARMTLGELSSVIHPYPTLAEVIKKVADAGKREKLTPLVKKILGWRLSLLK
jgi:pyruvate/2-oxoglutarate dehydrogenase complex dihydrolipoamide dehydrogenase (E3) component